MRRIDALLGLADRRTAGGVRARSVIAPALRDRQADLHEAMRRSLRLASRPPHTYLHGDLHIANTYLVDESRIGIADWQTGLRGCWAYDYAYIIATALEVEERRSSERELLALYLDRLGAVTGEQIPFPLAWEAYRQSFFYPYFAWLYTIGRSRVQPSFQPREVSLAMIERIAAAIADLDSLGAVGL
jgi:hypothetical protein